MTYEDFLKKIVNSENGDWVRHGNVLLLKSDIDITAKINLLPSPPAEYDRFKECGGYLETVHYELYFRGSLIAEGCLAKIGPENNIKYIAFPNEMNVISDLDYVVGYVLSKVEDRKRYDDFLERACIRKAYH